MAKAYIYNHKYVNCPLESGVHLNRVRLIHWNALDAEKRATILRAAGYEVDYEPLTPKALRKLRDDPPSAVVIDLTRLPIQGRDIALAVRHYKTSRHVPLVFVDGNPEKVARIKSQLPDAVYTTWSQIHSSLEQAIIHPPTVTVVPKSLLEGYSGTPLAIKLGIKANLVVALINAPEGFEKTLGELPRGVTLIKRNSGRPDLTIWFSKWRTDLKNNIARMRTLSEKGGLWIVWPKKASQMPSDLSQAIIRKTGLAAGLVDYKVCAIDTTWAGLLFTRRRSK